MAIVRNEGNGSPYIRYCFYSDIILGSFDQDFGSEWIDRPEFLSRFVSHLYKSIERHGFKIPKRYEFIADDAISALLNYSGIQQEGDSYTGQFYRLDVSHKDAFLKEYLEADEISLRLKRLGSSALQRALMTLAQEEGWETINDSDDEPDREQNAFEDISEDIVVPASDRIVLLSDNQQSEIEGVSSELIYAVECENSIDGDVDLRQRIIGELKSGRELIRAQSLRAYLLYSTVMEALSHLINKYGQAAIGHAAKKLLDLLIEHVFGKQ